ncbi:MAG TPA: GNAT family protein [Ktedonobacterales bacterium]|jgi:RimJ/RimL family protein N-acetyltransferase
MIRTTQRLILREFVAEDWAAVWDYQSDPRYLRYTRWTEREPEEVQAFIQGFLEDQQTQPRTCFQLAITLPGQKQLIGNCGLRLEHPGAQEGDIGYELAPQHWGQGYATEAAREMLALGFGEMGLHRIWAWCIAENVGSAHVLEKIGMRREGHHREKEWFKDRWWDTYVYAILAHEWQP